MGAHREGSTLALITLCKPTQGNPTAREKSRSISSRSPFCHQICHHTSSVASLKGVRTPLPSRRPTHVRGSDLLEGRGAMVKCHDQSYSKFGFKLAPVTPNMPGSAMSGRLE